MSSAVSFTSAAPGRPFVFDQEVDPEVGSWIDSPAVLPALPMARFHSTIENQQSTIPPIGNRQSKIESSVVPASRLEIRPAPMMVSSGISALDALTGGLPRGCLTEICGPASSGRTTVLLAALAAATRRGEFCAVVDASDTLDPHSAVAAGVELDRLLWVRCGAGSSPQRHGFSINNQKSTIKNTPNRQSAIDNRKFSGSAFEHRLEQVLRAADLLLESGGFGLIALDLGDLPPQAARCIPLTTWFRFRRVIEHTPTILLAIEPQAIAGSCSSLLLQLGAPGNKLDALVEHDSYWKSEANNSDGAAAKRQKNTAHGVSRGSDVGNEEAPKGRKKISPEGDPRFAEPTHAHLLTGLDITAEVIRSRMERKPVHSISAFASKTAWAG